MTNNFLNECLNRDEARGEVNVALKEQLAQRLNLPSQTQSAFAWLGVFQRPAFGLVGIGALVLVSFAVFHGDPAGPRVPGVNYGIDDWKEEVLPDPLGGLAGAQNAGVRTSSRTSLVGQIQDFFSSGSGMQEISMQAGMANSRPQPTSASFAGADSALVASEDAALGYSTGGAKDVNNFRENIQNGYMPLASDVTAEGLFYDYFFDTTTGDAPCQERFCPAYARAIAPNPLTNETEYYLAVGLNSNLKESDFVRPKTNFVIVLDISGSMGSPFDQYYYGKTSVFQEFSETVSRKTKLELATESIAGLMDHLKPDDRLGIVLFQSNARVAKPLNLVSGTDMQKIKEHLYDLQPTGGTNMSAGLEEAAALLAEQAGGEYQNRIIFLTDAMPNQGAVGGSDLQSLVQQYADRGIGTTLIGMGVDFQSELVHELTKARGANYLSVHSGEEFKERLDEQFDFLVTPLVYDLRLNVGSGGFAIDKIYGSPDADLSTGNVMHVRTLFPSKTVDGKTRGGLVLLKLRKTGSSNDLIMNVHYETADGTPGSSEARVSFPQIGPTIFDTADTYETTGVRKGILLARYAELLQQWIAADGGDARISQWERASQPLRVSSRFHDAFNRFLAHLSQEKSALGDNDLAQEEDILQKLLSISSPAPAPTPVFDDDWTW